MVAIFTRKRADPEPARLLLGAGPSRGAHANDETIWGVESVGGLRFVGYYPPKWQSLELGGPTQLSLNSPTASFAGQMFYVGQDSGIYAENRGGAQSFQKMYGGPNVALVNNETQLGPISGFYDDAGYQHLFYIGTDKNLHEYYSGPNQSTFSNNNLSAGTAWQGKFVQ